MAVAQLQRQWIDLTSNLLREGVVDDQFGELQRMQDESCPDFVFEIVSLYFQDSERLLAELGSFLDQRDVDFSKVDAHVHQLKGSSASVGAQRVKNVYLDFRNCCKEGSREGWKSRFWQPVDRYRRYRDDVAMAESCLIAGDLFFVEPSLCFCYY